MQQTTLWLALAILVVAAIGDLWKRRIPNALPLLLLILAVAACALSWHDIGWFSFAIGMILAFVVGLAGFGLGMLGGGDVKLMAALGAVLGMERLWPVLFWVALAGGVLGVVGRWRKQREIPYAPAIAAGLLLFLLVGGPLDVLHH